MWWISGKINITLLAVSGGFRSRVAISPSCPWWLKRAPACFLFAPVIGRRRSLGGSLFIANTIEAHETCRHLGLKTLTHAQKGYWYDGSDVDGQLNLPGIWIYPSGFLRRTNAIKKCFLRLQILTLDSYLLKI